MHYVQTTCSVNCLNGIKRNQRLTDSVLDGCWEINLCLMRAPCGTGLIHWRFHAKPLTVAVRHVESITGAGGERYFGFGGQSVLRRVGGGRERFDGNTTVSKLPVDSDFGSFDSCRLSTGIFKGILVRKSSFCHVLPLVCQLHRWLSVKWQGRP